ncbi:arginase family protein [Jiangella rhizosphaerae]|uniref:Arginase family protein n=1 Tax=Jiangella rhizosphaerae TaxID=2293569 RepID=A0A418KPX0_9ACTN|nr:arginase family protein [Jiangella rhizosphaerae]RIQ21884.1 arginase family protein [Jiangella rhizosphaerae]
MTTLGLLGVPSSAAAHWPGQERAPAALRSAGLVELLRATGRDIADHGDRPVRRWAASPAGTLDARPNNLDAVLDVLGDTRDAVAGILAAGELPFVVGGECTLTIAVISAFAAAGQDVGLMYVDGGQDLMTPADHPYEPIADGMGVAHLLDIPGTAPALSGFGPRRPLLTADHVCFFGYADDEEDVHGRVPSWRFPVAAVAPDPPAAARLALSAVTSVADRFVVHLDVDVVNFLDLPAADVPQYRGLTLDQVVRAVSVMTQHPGFAGLVLTEFNPDHGEPDGSTARRLAEAVATVLARHETLGP